MDHFNDTPNQKLAQAIITKTEADLYKADPTLHMEFHSYVSYPPENRDAPVYFHTNNAIEEYNQTPRTDNENKTFNDRVNMYSKLLFDTNKQVKKELINF